MERMIAPLIALLIAVPAHSAYDSGGGSDAPSSGRCDEPLLTRAMMASNPATVLPAGTHQGGKLVFPAPGQGNALCQDDAVWRYVEGGTGPTSLKSAGNPAGNLSDQVTDLYGVAVQFDSLDQTANQTIALADELLQKGEKLGLVKKNADGSHTVTSATNVWNLPTKTTLEQKKKAVLELLSTAAAPAVPEGVIWVTIGHAAGTRTKAYYQKVLQLRDAVKAFAAHSAIKDAEVTKRLGYAPATTAASVDSWATISVLMQKLAVTKGSHLRDLAALVPVDEDLADRIARPHMAAQLMLQKYDELIAHSYKDGVTGYLAHIDKLIQERAATGPDASKAPDQKQQAEFQAKLEEYRKTFESKTREELSAGIDQRTDLTPEAKADLKAEYGAGTVGTKVGADGRTMFTYTVIDKSGKPKIVSETPAPETMAQITHPGNAEGDAKIVAQMILSGQDFQASLTAFVTAVTTPDPVPTETVTTPDGKTLTPMEQVKQGVPWWRKLIDPFHGKMQKYKRRQMHQLSKEAAETSQERKKVAEGFDGQVAALKTKLDQDFFYIDQNPKLTSAQKEEQKKKLQADFDAQKASLESQKKTQLDALEAGSSDSQKQGMQNIDATLQAAYDGQIRLQVAALQEAYKKEVLKRDAIAQEAGLVSWHIDPESLKNVATSYMTDADVDGYFAASWAPGQDQASVDACRQALGFEATDDPKTRLKDPTRLRVDNRCVHDGLLAHLKGLVAPENQPQPKKERSGVLKKVLKGELKPKDLLPQENK